MRAFLLGTAFGAAVGGLGVYVGSASLMASPQAVAAPVPMRATAAVNPVGVVEKRAAVIETPVAASAPTGMPLVSPAAGPTAMPAAANAGATTAPIALSADHAKVLAPNASDGRRMSLSELHMQLSSEGKDPAWAFETENALRQALAQGNGSAEFEILNVECRTSLCEILAFGNLPSSGQRWNQVVDDTAKQPWGANFTGNSTSTVVRNGRYTIVTVLQRAKH